MVPKLKLLTQQLIYQWPCCEKSAVMDMPWVGCRWRWLLGIDLLRLWTLWLFTRAWSATAQVYGTFPEWPLDCNKSDQVKAFRGPMGSQLCWGLHLPCAGLQCPISFWAEKWPASHASPWKWMDMNGMLCDSWGAIPRKCWFQTREL